MEIFCIAFCSTWRYVIIIYGLRIQCTFVLCLKIWCFFVIVYTFIWIPWFHFPYTFIYWYFCSSVQQDWGIVPSHWVNGPCISRLHNDVIFRGHTAQEWIWPLKMRPLHDLEMPRTIYPVTQHHIQEEWRLQSSVLCIYLNITFSLFQIVCLDRVCSYVVTLLFVMQ